MEKLSRPLIFVVDDDPEIRTILRRLFTMEDYLVEVFSSARYALEALERHQGKESKHCDLIVCDLKLPDLDGLGFLEILRRKKMEIPLIFVTAHGSVETAVEALRKGAFDYVLKPINLNELSIVASRVFEEQQTKDERSELREQLQNHLSSSVTFGEMIGSSSKIRQVYDLVTRVAKSNSNVLITGESGTGKEMVARLIHQKGDRCGLPFVAINCSAIPDQLLESELFGHRKGAFTGANESRIGLFEEARGGTVFLDEIGDMPLGLQAKLLRVIQERKIKPVGDNHLREIDVRIISATHKNMRRLIQEGKFREDLYYRICVIPIQIPALRERKEDIPLMASFFLRKHSEANHLPTRRLTKNALTKLLQLSWPGNVRELENALERAVVLSEQELIDEQDLQIGESESPDSQVPELFSKLLTLKDLERSYLQYVLEVTHYAKEKAAQIMGINRKTLYRKEIEYGMAPDQVDG